MCFVFELQGASSRVPETKVLQFAKKLIVFGIIYRFFKSSDKFNIRFLCFLEFKKKMGSNFTNCYGICSLFS